MKGKKPNPFDKGGKKPPMPMRDGKKGKKC